MDPSTFTQCFLPLRLHTITRNVIDVVVNKHKPKGDRYYYGLILAERIVVGVLKNEGKVSIVPTGKKFFLLSFSKRYQPDLQLH